MVLTENTIFDGRYLLLRMLGRGGSSEVWLADDQLSGLQVAVKVYAPGIGLDEDGVQAFSEEFKLVFNLNHTNLLRPTHYAICDRMPYLVMPYLKMGSSVKHVGEFTEEQAWHFLLDVASGLEYLHNRIPPVIHQDIKPDNILIDDDGDFLVTDFGISTKMRSTLPTNLLATGSMTMAYAAPERWSRKNRPVMSGDIWALGASVFELLTGYPPYGELGGRLQFDGAEIPEMEGDWSEELNEIVARCLQRETADRPTASEIISVCKSYFDKDVVLEPMNPHATRPLGKQTVSITSPVSKKTIMIHADEDADKSKRISKPTVYRKQMTEKGDPEAMPKQQSPTVRKQDTIYSPLNIFLKQKKIILGVAAILLLVVVGYFSFSRKENPKKTGTSHIAKYENTISQKSEVIVADTVETVEIENPENTNVRKEEPEEVVPPIEKKINKSEYLDKGNKCFNEGNYSEAVDNYNKAGNNVSPTRLKAAEECASARRTADQLFRQQKYEEALKEYRKILSHNQFDRNVKIQIEECEKQMNTIQP